MSEIIYRDPSGNSNNSSRSIVEIGEMVNFPDWRLFEGDAGKDPFFDVRIKAAIIAMAKFLDYMDQTETYPYYSYGKRIKDYLSYGSSLCEAKQAVLQLAKHSYFFEQESTHPKTIFQNKDWIRASLNEIDLWPNQVEIQYERFVASCQYSTNPIYRRVEVSQVIASYEKKLEQFSFESKREWAHLWTLIQDEYND